MPSPAGTSPAELLPLLGDAAPAATALAAELAAAPDRLPVLFPGLPRRFGRQPLRGGRRTLGAATVDLDAFRSCDLAAAWLLATAAPAPAVWFDLYAHGDIEERTMLLRALHFAPPGPTTVQLFGEVQRTNMVVHLEAAVCDGDLFVRTLGQPGFDTTTANRLLLKLAFLDLPLRRAFGAEQHANQELSRMLLDLASEREAAGRAVWRDTARLIGRAPVPGCRARLLGGLEHGDDGMRLSAAEGLLALGDPALRAFAAERLPREPRETVRAVLQQLQDR